MARFDQYIQIIPASSYNGFKFFSFGQKRTLGVSGIQKLVNIFSIELLTPVGSDPLNLNRGSNLTSLLGSNVSVNDARDILFLAVDKTAKAIQSYQTGLELPDTERLSSASVTQFIEIVDAPGFAAQIFVENVADQGLAFLLPTLQVRNG